MTRENLHCSVVASTEDRAVILKILKEFPKISAVKTYPSSGKFDYSDEHSDDILIADPALLNKNIETLFQSTENRPEIILISSDRDLAVEGYEYSLSGFLTKPVDKIKVFKAVQKAEQNILKEEEKQKASEGSRRSFLFIRAEYKLMRIDFEDILYIEGLKDYSKIYTKLASNKAIITLQNLKSFEEKLYHEDFIRVHRSYIVSLSKIDIIHKNSILIGKTEIPVSDGFRSHLHSVIAKYL